jgi:hypothetical protein
LPTFPAVKTVIDASRLEHYLPISIELNGIADLEIKKRIERVIRDCIGVRPMEEVWKVQIRASFAHCQVIVKAPTQTRERMFFDDIHVLPEKIRSWLESYPFR